LHGNGEGARRFIDGWIKRGGQQISVVDYNEHAIGAGTDAEAVAYVHSYRRPARVGVALITTP